MPEGLFKEFRCRGLARGVEQREGDRIDEVVVRPVVQAGEGLIERGGNVSVEDRQVSLHQIDVLLDVLVHGSLELFKPPVPERFWLLRLFHNLEVIRQRDICFYMVSGPGGGAASPMTLERGGRSPGLRRTRETEGLIHPAGKCCRRIWVCSFWSLPVYASTWKGSVGAWI
ncbi:protein of unknown function [Methanoculleus bourgensis]|uniref:Uncharacterized protein n=1 Tax=Methanoculleus bourgensis TaxID=83986 RepID=A0A0X3BK20_9EURY|nr:protein of unknown function [Methanoculleus bourgensis]